MDAVALGIKPPDPNQAFDSINNILGIQQKRQALQVQAQELAQEQIKTQAAQGFQQFTSDFDPAAHIGPDGTLDVAGVRASTAYKNAGNAKPLVDEYIQKVQNGQLGAKQALQTLDSGSLAQMSQGVGALANDKDVLADNAAGREKVSNFYRTFAQQSPEAARIAGLYGGVVQHAKQGDLSDAVYAQQLMGADVLGQRSQQNPTRGTNAAGQATIANPRTGLTALVPTTGGGDVNPTAPAVAGAQARATGTASSDIDRGNEVSAMQQPASAAIPLTKRIDELAHEINSGHLAKMISESGNYLGFSNMNEARSQLNKDLGMVKGVAIARSGSDSRANTVLEGYPTDTTPENTIHAAMDYIRGAARQNLARGELLTQYQTKDPKGLQGFQAADNVLTRNSDPLVHEFLSLKPADQAGFYRRNFSSPAEAQDFKNHVNAVKRHTRVIGGE